MNASSADKELADPTQTQEEGEIPQKDNPEKPPAKVLTKDEKDMLDLQKKATAFKNQAMQTSSSALQLLQEISDKVEWGWANNPDNRDRTLGLLNAFRNSLSPFGRSLLVQDFQVMKKTEAEQWRKELEAFLSSKPKLEGLATFLKRMLKRHNA